MTLVITLVAFIIERFFHWNQLRQWRWFSKFQFGLATRFAQWPTYLLLALCILPLLIIVELICILLDYWIFGIPNILFNILVLLYCMGPRNLWADVASCINALNSENPAIAIERAQLNLGITEPKNSQQFHATLTRAIFIEAHERVFAVLFWFLLIGPMGAVLYRTVALCAEEGTQNLAQTAAVLQRILDWLPARLYTFIFALGGHFTEVFSLWKKDAKKGISENDRLIAECGINALDARENKHLAEDGSAEKGALELLDRVFIMLLVLIALLELILK